MPLMSAAFEHWIGEAIELAVGCYGDGDEAPILLGEGRAEKRHLVELQVAGEVDGNAVWDVARELVDKKWLRYAIVVSGYYKAGRSRKPAILLECADRSMPEAIVLAQPFRTKPRRPRCVSDGDVFLVEKRANQLQPRVPLKDPPKKSRQKP